MVDLDCIMKKINISKTLLLLLFLLPLLAKAQSFTVDAPNAVAMGERFQIVFTLEGGSGSGFRAPAFNNFDVIYGPAIMQSSSVQIINGKRSDSNTTSYTYTLMPKAQGIFNVGAASIRVGGKNYTTSPKQIKVLQANSNTPGNSNSVAADDGSRYRGETIFYRAIANKTKVYEQEAITLTFKLYIATRIGIQQLEDLKMPEFEGFITQTVENGSQAQLSLETYNGRNYRTAVIQKMILFPQKAGQITIPKGMLQASITLPPDNDDDPIFGQRIVTSRKVFSAPITIDVLPLPTEGKPTSFNGAVGQFQMTSKLTSGQPKTNEATTIKVNISGFGNIKLVAPPTLKFPDTFEVYDPKINSDIKVEERGSRGYKEIEYYAVPRQTGTFTIDPVEFSYFDPDTRSYKTLKSDPIKLVVEKGKGGVGMSSSAASKEDIKLLSEDISYLKTTPGAQHLKGINFTYSLWYWMIYLFILILGGIYYLVLRNIRQMNNNETVRKHKRANNIARKRLKEANKYRQEGNKAAFDTAMVQALWGYLGDKFKVTLSELNRSNIEQILRAKGAPEDLIKETLIVIDETEFAKYAPSADQMAMDKLYDKVEKVIEKIEDAKLK